MHQVGMPDKNVALLCQEFFTRIIFVLYQVFNQKNIRLIVSNGF